MVASIKVNSSLIYIYNIDYQSLVTEVSNLQGMKKGKTELLDSITITW